jgi:hypothetical protein
MIGVDFKIARPDELVVVVTLTATVGELRALSKQLVGQWPSFQLSQDLACVIREAEKVYRSDNCTKQ